MLSLIIFISTSLFFAIEQPKEPCLPDTETNREILERFITRTSWEKKRLETGTEMLSMSDVEVLESNNLECPEIKKLYSKGIDEIYSDGQKVHNTTIYKVGNFYFITFSLRQSDNKNEITSGLSHIYVMNSSFDQLGGWTF